MIAEAEGVQVQPITVQQVRRVDVDKHPLPKWLKVADEVSCVLLRDRDTSSVLAKESDPCSETLSVESCVDLPLSGLIESAYGPSGQDA